MPATEQETTMTDTKAIEKALRELERVRDIVIHMPQPGNWDIVVNTLVEDIDKLIPSATAALAALLAEQEKLREALDAATGYIDALLRYCRLDDGSKVAQSAILTAGDAYRAARNQVSD
jgi:hypothetical protein